MIALRSRPLFALAAIAGAIALGACFGTSTADPNAPPTVSVSNVTSATCTHQVAAGGVLCTISLDVQLHNASIFDTLVTIGTNDTLTQQWLLSAIGEGINYSFPGSKLSRSDTGCLRPQSTITVYDGPTAQYPVIATATISPITLTCN